MLYFYASPNLYFMFITKQSTLSGNWNTLEIDITEEQFFRVENRRANGELIQNIVPNVSKELREFLMNGITPTEWEQYFGSMNEV